MIWSNFKEKKKAASLQSKEKPERERDFSVVFSDNETANDLTTSQMDLSLKCAKHFSSELWEWHQTMEQ